MSAATPTDIHKGGLNISISALSTWLKCERLYFWQYVYENEDGSHGIEPMYTKDYLLIGSGVHAGLAAYYLSGWRDGLYSLDAGLEGARAHLAPRANESPSEDEFAKVQAETERLIRNYDAEYGPNSAAPEWPNTRIADIDGKPLIECTFSVPLYTGHVLTVRPDAVVWNFDTMMPFEHKVPAASSVSRTIGEAGLSGQGLAQEAILAQHGVPARGNLLNVIVRGPVRNTRPFQRFPVSHDPWAVHQLLKLAGDTVTDIIRATERWEMLKADGFNQLEAAKVAFRLVGTLSGHCVGKFGPCSKYDLCAHSGNEQRMLSGFRQRVYKSDLPTEV